MHRRCACWPWAICRNAVRFVPRTAFLVGRWRMHSPRRKMGWCSCNQSCNEPTRILCNTRAITKSKHSWIADGRIASRPWNNRIDPMDDSFVVRSPTVEHLRCFNHRRICHCRFTALRDRGADYTSAQPSTSWPHKSRRNQSLER